MKRMTLLAALAAVFSLSACEKSYECDCTVELDVYGSMMSYSTDRIIESHSEADAQKRCDAHKEEMEKRYDYPGATKTSYCTMNKIKKSGPL